MLGRIIRKVASICIVGAFCIICCIPCYAETAFDKAKRFYDNHNSNSISTLTYYLAQDDMPNEHLDSIVKLSAQITKGVDKNYDKAKAIHDWVSENMWHDKDFQKAIPSDKNAWEIINDGYGACYEFSKVTAALLRACGIPTRLVNGSAISRAGSFYEYTYTHQWAEAFIDGKWIIVDSSLDTGNIWANGKKYKSNGLLYSQFFNPDLATLVKYCTPVELVQKVPTKLVREDGIMYFLEEDGTVRVRFSGWAKYNSGKRVYYENGERQ